MSRNLCQDYVKNNFVMSRLCQENYVTIMSRHFPIPIPIVMSGLCQENHVKIMSRTILLCQDYFKNVIIQIQIQIQIPIPIPIHIHIHI